MLYEKGNFKTIMKQLFPEFRKGNAGVFLRKSRSKLQIDSCQITNLKFVFLNKYLTIIYL